MAKLYFRYATMASGKSLDLLKVAYNYEELGKKVLLCTSAFDTRFGYAVIASRIGISKEAKAFDKNDNIYEYVKSLKEKPSCILMDESQFLTKKQVYELSDIVDFLDIPVICYGLKTNFKLELFEGSKALLELADKIQELKTICKCGKKATVNALMIDNKIQTDGPKILIGGNEKYKPMCRKCFKNAIK